MSQRIYINTNHSEISNGLPIYIPSTFPLTASFRASHPFYSYQIMWNKMALFCDWLQFMDSTFFVRWDLFSSSTSQVADYLI